MWKLYAEYYFLKMANYVTRIFSCFVCLTCFDGLNKLLIKLKYFICKQIEGNNPVSNLNSGK